MAKYTVHAVLEEKFHSETTVEANSKEEAKKKVVDLADACGVSSDGDTQFNWDYYESEFEVTDVTEGEE